MTSQAAKVMDRHRNELANQLMRLCPGPSCACILDEACLAAARALMIEKGGEGSAAEKS